MRSHAALHPLRVAAVDELTDDAVAITFDVPPELRDDYAFVHGQHVSVRGADDVRRSFSICTPPSSGVLRIGVKRLPGGAFSDGIVGSLRVGDTLEVMTPAGRFTTDLDPTAAKRYVAVAAGSGITPVLSIVAAVLEGEPGSQVTLVYANRTSRSIMFLDEVHDLKDRFPERLQILHVLSREQQDVELLSGRLDADRFRAIVEAFGLAGSDDWFLCGPHDMVVDLRQALTDLGETRIHTELFHADPGPEGAGRRPGRRHGRGRAGHDPARRPSQRLPAAAGRSARPRGGARRTQRPAVRVQGRGLRHLPGQAGRGHGADGRQLRTRARGGRARLRAHLPVSPDRGDGRARLRRLTGAGQR